MLTPVGVPTVVDSMMNVPEVWPPGIVIVAGTVAALRFVVASPTSAPPSGAGPVRVTVPTDRLWLPMFGGLSSNVARVTGAAGGGTGVGVGVGVGVGAGDGVGAAGMVPSPLQPHNISTTIRVGIRA